MATTETTLPASPVPELSDPPPQTPDTPKPPPAPVDLTLREYIDQAGDKLGVPKPLRDSIFQNESSFEHFNPDGSIKMGKMTRYGWRAKGVGQLSPDIEKEYNVNGDDPIANAYASLKHQKKLYDKYLAAQGGDTGQAGVLAAAAYNSGEHNVDKYNGVPPFAETQDYVKKVANHLKKNPITSNVPTPAPQSPPVPQPQLTKRQQAQAAITKSTTYDTPLTPAEESQFKTWKQKYAPKDTGEDYDLRGAFKAGLKPDPKSGHWPDTFKKPNHPTFSNESQYAVGPNAARAGHWEGDQFIPPAPAEHMGTDFNQSVGDAMQHVAANRAARGLKPPVVSQPAPTEADVTPEMKTPDFWQQALVDRQQKQIDQAYGETQTDTAHRQYAAVQQRVAAARRRIALHNAAAKRAQVQAAMDLNKPLRTPPRPQPLGAGAEAGINTGQPQPSEPQTVIATNPGASEPAYPSRQPTTTVDAGNAVAVTPGSGKGFYQRMGPSSPIEPSIVDAGNAQPVAHAGSRLEQPVAPPLKPQPPFAFNGPKQQRGGFSLSPTSTGWQANLTARGYEEADKSLADETRAKVISEAGGQENIDRTKKSYEQIGWDPAFVDAAIEDRARARAQTQRLAQTNPQDLKDIQETVDSMLSHSYLWRAANIGLDKSVTAMVPASAAGMLKVIGDVTNSEDIRRAASQMSKEVNKRLTAGQSASEQLGSTEQNVEYLFKTAGNVVQLWGLIKVLGVTKAMSASSGLSALGTTESYSKAAGAGIKGAAYGELFKFLPNAEPFPEAEGALQKLANLNTDMVAAGLGTYGIERSTGSDHQTALDAALQNSLLSGVLRLSQVVPDLKRITDPYVQPVIEKAARAGVESPHLPEWLRLPLADIGNVGHAVVVEDLPPGAPGMAIVKHGEEQTGPNANVGRVMSVYGIREGERLGGTEISGRNAASYAAGDKGTVVHASPEEYDALLARVNSKNPEPAEGIGKGTPAQPQLTETSQPKTPLPRTPEEVAAPETARAEREATESLQAQRERATPPESPNAKQSTLDAIDRANKAGDGEAVKQLIKQARAVGAATEEIDEVLKRPSSAVAEKTAEKPTERVWGNAYDESGGFKEKPLPRFLNRKPKFDEKHTIDFALPDGETNQGTPYNLSRVDSDYLKENGEDPDNFIQVVDANGLNTLVHERSVIYPRQREGFTPQETTPQAPAATKQPAIEQSRPAAAVPTPETAAPATSTALEWKPGTVLTEGESRKAVQAIRAGDPRSKNEGRSISEVPTGRLQQVELPVSSFAPEYIDYLRESTNADRVQRYVSQKIDTPIYATPGKHAENKGKWTISDGGHRLLAAIERGDSIVRALVPEGSFKEPEMGRDMMGKELGRKGELTEKQAMHVQVEGTKALEWVRGKDGQFHYELAADDPRREWIKPTEPETSSVLEQMDKAAIERRKSDRPKDLAYARAMIESRGGSLTPSPKGGFDLEMGMNSKHVATEAEAATWARDTSTAQDAVYPRNVQAKPEWEQFPPESGTLGIARASMPQIKSEHRGALANALRSRGISYTEEEVLPGELKPSQAEYSPAKVEKARGWTGTERKLLVSSDGFVLDGHHQWKQKLEDHPDTPIPIIRLGVPAQEALLNLAAFPSSTFDGTHHETPVPEAKPAISLEAGNNITSEKGIDSESAQDRPRRNAINSHALEDALSPKAQAALAEMFKKRQNLGQRYVREAMEVHHRLLEGQNGDVKDEAAAKTVLDAAEKYFNDETGDNAIALQSATWSGLSTLTGEKDPDQAELLENEVFADAKDAGRLIFDTLDPKTASFDTEEFNTAFGDVEFRRADKDVFPTPSEHISARKAQGEITPEEAAKRIQSWKDFAQRVGKEEDHSNETILSLYDVTGQWSQPYVDAGYNVIRFDIKNGDDLMDFGEWMMRIEEEISEGRPIVGVLAAPPCTSFAVSGARWWKSQHDIPDKSMVAKKYGLWATNFFDTPLDYANTLVAVTKLVVQQSDPNFYIMENPVGRIASQNNLPKPTLSFDPHNYGDPYTKQTLLWGDFNPHLPTANVNPTLGSLMHKLRGDVEEEKAQRSETPEGFAYAFFIANNTSRLPFEGVVTRGKSITTHILKAVVKDYLAAEEKSIEDVTSGHDTRQHRDLTTETAELIDAWMRDDEEMSGFLKGRGATTEEITQVLYDLREEELGEKENVQSERPGTHAAGSNDTSEGKTEGETQRRPEESTPGTQVDGGNEGNQPTEAEVKEAQDASSQRSPTPVHVEGAPSDSAEVGGRIPGPGTDQSPDARRGQDNGSTQETASVEAAPESDEDFANIFAEEFANVAKEQQPAPPSLVQTPAEIATKIAEWSGSINTLLKAGPSSDTIRELQKLLDEGLRYREATGINNERFNQTLESVAAAIKDGRARATPEPADLQPGPDIIGIWRGRMNKGEKAETKAEQNWRKQERVATKSGTDATTPEKSATPFKDALKAVLPAAPPWWKELTTVGKREALKTAGLSKHIHKSGIVTLWWNMSAKDREDLDAQHAALSASAEPSTVSTYERAVAALNNIAKGMNQDVVAKNARRLADIIDNKSPFDANGILGDQNKSSRKVFTELTGVNLGATNLSARDAIEKWIAGEPVGATNPGEVPDATQPQQEATEDIAPLGTAAGKYRVEMQATGENEWSPGGKDFATPAEAAASASRTFMNWMGAHDWRIVPADHPTREKVTKEQLTRDASVKALEESDNNAIVMPLLSARAQYLLRDYEELLKPTGKVGNEHLNEERGRIGDELLALGITELPGNRLPPLEPIKIKGSDYWNPKPGPVTPKTPVESLDDINDAIDDILGDDTPTEDNGTASFALPVPKFDPSVYAKLKPLFTKALVHFYTEGMKPGEALRGLIRHQASSGKFSLEKLAKMQPYMIEFAKDLQAGKVDLPKKQAENKPDANQDQPNADDRPQTQGAGPRVVPGTTGVEGTGQVLEPAGGRSSGNAGGTTGRSGTGSDTVETLPAGSSEGTHGAEPAGGGDSDQSGIGSSYPGDQQYDPDGPHDYLAPEGSLAREGSWRETARTNLDVLELVKKIEAEARLATHDEQALLVKFTGWGATEIANNLFPGANRYTRSGEREIDPDYARSGWTELAQRAKELFSQDELKQALASTRNAHYTAEKIVRGIWTALQQFGFHSGNILEGGMGIGLFPVAAPKTMMQHSRYTGIERDEFTARIAKLLLPNQVVLHNDFVDQKLPKNFFDVSAGNFPFADTVIDQDPAYRKERFNLHDYFIAKTLDSIRQGGVMAVVTSKGTMDKGNDKMRQYVADRADLLGAIRLPQTAFKQNAGTEVVTDVLFFRKRMPDEEPGGEAWLGRGEISGLNESGQLVTGHPINEYFVAHPEMVLGKHAFTGSMHKENEYTVEPQEGDIEDHFTEALKNLPTGVYANQAKSTETTRAATARDFNPASKKEGSIYIHADGTLRRVENGSGVVLGEIERITKPEETWLRDYIVLRTALKTAQTDQLNDGDWEKSLAELNKVYDKFVAKHGRINECKVTERIQTTAAGDEVVKPYYRFKNKRVLLMDVESPLIKQLEKLTESNELEKSNVLLSRQINPPQDVQIRALSDAVAVSLDQIGSLNLEHVTELMQPVQKMTIDEVIAELGDAIYEAPGGGWQMSDEYLSGFVVDKLEEARAAAQVDPRYLRNIEALTKVQPKPLSPANITVQLGAAWVPIDVYNQFASEVIGLQSSPEYPAISYNPLDNQFTVAAAHGPGSQSLRTAAADWGTARRSSAELLETAFNGGVIRIQDKDSDGRTYTDVTGSDACNDIVKRMKKEIQTWVWTDAARAKSVTDLYNRVANNIAPRTFNGDHMSLPGYCGPKPYPHQLRAAWRIISSGNTYLAHAVGAGKTLEMIISAMEMRRLGLVRKPMFIVPAWTLKQFQQEFLEAYPLARILVADEENFNKERRQSFVAQSALNDLDAVILTHSAFKIIGTTQETANVVVDEMIQQLRDAMRDLDENDMRERRTIKEIEARIERIERQFKGRTSTESKDQVVNFEDLGVDFLYVDEAHGYRKLDFITNNPQKGITPDGSKAALDLLIKMRWLDQQRPGRSAVLASGTPVTNTMAELYTVQRFLGQHELDAIGISHFDAWASMFGETLADLELNAAGVYEMVSRFRQFVNLPELMKRVRQFMDVLTFDQLRELVNLPTIKGGNPSVVVVPETEEGHEYRTGPLLHRLEDSKAWKPSFDQPNNPDPVINIITDGKLAALDMRFIYNQLPSNPESKLNVFIDKLIDYYHDTKDIEYVNKKTGETDPIKGGTHIVFAPWGFGERIARTRGFNARDWMLKRLIEGGVPESEIAFMQDYKKLHAKQAMFAEMRNGRKKILVGSPGNMGTGVNVQKRLTFSYFLSPPWYPADVQQPDGRIVRQGNQNEEVELLRFGVKGTYDSTGWGMVSSKARMIEQAFIGDDSIRKIGDIAESSLYEQASAMMAGDPRALQLAGLRRDIEELHRGMDAHRRTQGDMKYARDRAESDIRSDKAELKDVDAALKLIGEYGYVGANEFFAMDGGKRLEKRTDIGKALLDSVARAQAKYGPEVIKKDAEPVRVILPTKVMDKFEMSATVYTDYADRITSRIRLTVGNLPYDIGEGGIQEDHIAQVDPQGIATRVFNSLNDVRKQQTKLTDNIEKNKRTIKQLESKIGAPYPQESELYDKQAELSQLESELTGTGNAAPTVPHVTEEFDKGRLEGMRQKWAAQGEDGESHLERYATPEVTISIWVQHLNELVDSWKSAVDVTEKKRYDELVDTALYHRHESAQAMGGKKFADALEKYYKASKTYVAPEPETTVTLEPESASMRGPVQRGGRPDPLSPEQVMGEAPGIAAASRPHVNPQFASVPMRYIGAVDRDSIVEGEADPNGDKEHSDIGIQGDSQWRYVPITETVYWTLDDPPDLDTQHAVENWLDRRGQFVKAHDTLERLLDKQMEGPMFAASEGQPSTDDLTVAGNIITVNELLRQILTEAYRQSDASDRVPTDGIAGVFENDPKGLAASLELVAHMQPENAPAARKLASAVLEAGKDGTVRVQTPAKRLHEGVHEGAFEGSSHAAIADQLTPAGFARLAAHPAWPAIQLALLGRGVSNNVPRLVSEAIAELASGELLGLADTQADDWMVEYFKAFAEKNGNVSLKKFKELALNGQTALAAAADTGTEGGEHDASLQNNSSRGPEGVGPPHEESAGTSQFASHDPWERAKELTEDLQEHPQGEWPTGIKNAVTDQEREDVGKNPVLIEARRTIPEVFDSARANFDPAASEIKTAELRKHPRALNAEETAEMIIYKTHLKNRYDTAAKALIQSEKAGDVNAGNQARGMLTKLDQDLDTYQEMARRTGYEQGLGLRLRAEMMKQDYSLATVRLRARVLNDGYAVPPDLQQQLDDLVAERDAAVKALEDYDEAASQRAMEAELKKRCVAQRRTDRAAERQDKAIIRREHRVITKQELSVKMADLTQKWRAAMSRLSANPFLDPELYKIIGEMVETLLEAGANSVAEIVDPIYNIAQEMGTEGSERELRDAISGYGNVIQMSKEEIDIRRREIKSLARDVSALEDIEGGQRPARTGLQRDKPSQRLRESKKRVNAALRQYGLEIERSERSPEEMQQSALDAAKTRVRNRIEDLNSYIAGGERTPKRPSVAPDAELQAMMSERDRLQQVLDDIEGPRTYTDDEKIEIATQAIQKSIETYEQRIADGEVTVKAKEVAPWSRELGRLQQRKSELVKRLADLRKQNADVRAKKAQQALTALQKLIDDLETRIKTGDLTPKSRAKVEAATPELAEARKERRALQSILADLRREAKPEKTEGEISAAKLKALTTRLEKKDKDLAEKLRTGNFAKKTRPIPPSDPNVLKLRAGIKRKEEEINVKLHEIEIANRTKLEKGLDLGVQARRAVALSSTFVLWKLTTAAYARILLSIGEEVIGTPLPYLPILGTIARQAPSEGYFSGQAEINHIVKATSKEMLGQMKQALMTGSLDIDLEYGKTKSHGDGWLRFIGQMHLALKTPAKVASWERFYQKNLEWFARHGYDPNDEPVKALAGARALVDANRAILQQDNWLSDKFAKLANVDDPKSMWDKLAGAGLRIMFPVTRVAPNFILEAANYTPLGAAAATTKLLYALWTYGLEESFPAIDPGNAEGGAGSPPIPPRTITPGVDPFAHGVPPDLADSITRGYKKSALGAMFMLLAVLSAMGLTSAIQFGGYYGKGKKRKKGDVPFGGIRVFGIDLPTWMTHVPLFEAMQATASAVQVYREYHDKSNDPEESVYRASLGTVAGAASEIPFYEEPARALAAMDGWEGWVRYSTDLVRGMVVPPDVQRAARITDPTQPTTATQKAAEFLGLKRSEATKRKPEGSTRHRAWQEFELGIPGLRKHVPADKDKLRLDEETDVTDKVRSLQKSIGPELFREVLTADDTDRGPWNKLSPAQQAEWTNVTKEMGDAVAKGVLKPDDPQDIVRNSQLTPFQLKFKQKGVVAAIKDYKAMPQENKEQVFDLLVDKGPLIKDLYATEQEEARKDFESATAEPPRDKVRHPRSLKYFQLMERASNPSPSPTP